jgi:hypothetical protein
MVAFVRCDAEEGLADKIMTKLPIHKIRVRNRYRKTLGDIESLAASIKEWGLLHPIVVRPDGRLIAGERRLAACKRLGWKSVPVTYVDLKEVVRGEFAENAHRKDFLPSEIEAIRRAIEPHERAAAKERQRKHGGTAPGRRKHSGQVSPSDGRTRDRIGAFAGISGRSLAKIQAIVEAGERNPRRFGPLVAQMGRNGRIDGGLSQASTDERRRTEVGRKATEGEIQDVMYRPSLGLYGFEYSRKGEADLCDHVAEANCLPCQSALGQRRRHICICGPQTPTYQMLSN